MCTWLSFNKRAISPKTSWQLGSLFFSQLTIADEREREAKVFKLQSNIGCNTNLSGFLRPVSSWKLCRRRRRLSSRLCYVDFYFFKLFSRAARALWFFSSTCHRPTRDYSSKTCLISYSFLFFQLCLDKYSTKTERKPLDKCRRVTQKKKHKNKKVSPPPRISICVCVFSKLMARVKLF